MINLFRLSLYRILYSNMQRNFPRKLNKPEENKEVSTILPQTIKISNKIDQNLEEMKRIALLHVSDYELPKNIKEKAKKIFSKYKSSEIKLWGKNLRMVFARMHSFEKQNEIMNLIPFAVSKDDPKSIKYPLKQDLKNSNFNNILEKEDEKDIKINEIQIQETNVNNPYTFKKEPQQLKYIEYKDSTAIAYLYSYFPRTYFVILNRFN